MVARWRYSIALGALTASSGAFAQTAPPATPPSGPAFTPNKAPPEGETGEPRRGVGPLAGIGNRLADDGIRIRALLTNDLAGNVRGGADQGTRNVGQFYIGTDLDLNKLVGWKGAKFHFTLYRDYGHGLAKEVTGTFIKQQSIYKNEYTQWHFGLISIEQSLFHDKLDIIAGRLGSTAFYGHIQTGCYFQQGVSCGIPIILNSEAGYSLLPSATWGANVKYKVGQHGYIEAGAFEVNPFIAHTRGLDFSTFHATGYTVPFEMGYGKASFSKFRYPFEIKVGGYLSTATRVDPFYNAKGQSAGLTGTTQRSATALRSGFYVLADKTVWRPDPKRLKSLTLFGGYVQPLEDEEVLDRQIYGGAVFRGIVPGRDRDSLGLLASYLHVSPKEVAYLRDNRIRLGGGGEENPNEFAFEVNYGIAIGRSIRLSPNVQYIVHPDNANLPKINFVPKNVVTFGLRLVINAATLAGMPPLAAQDD